MFTDAKLAARGIAAGVLLGAALHAGATHAATLDLVLGLPDVASEFLDIAYDADTDTLTADGFALTYDDNDIGGDDLSIAGGTFSLTAIIDASGNFVSGSVSVGGTIASEGFTSGDLISGTLTDFGFPDAGGNPLEFIFTPTSGDLLSLYNGREGGIILGATLFPGSWAADWANNGTGVADTAPIPVPAGLLLLGSALPLLSLTRRRRAGGGAHP